jgi:hypothetical protein
MTQGEPRGLDAAEQERLTRQLGRALVGAAGPGWQRLWAQYRSAGRHVEADMVVVDQDRHQRPVRPPMATIELFGRLRGGMYGPERGTWLSATFTVESSGDYSVTYEADEEPAWRRVPPMMAFTDELRWFPRAEESVPDWLRTRAGLVREPVTPPEGTPRA